MRPPLGRHRGAFWAGFGPQRDRERTAQLVWSIEICASAGCSD